MATVTTRNDQFKLHAYICGNACLQTPDVDGTISFAMVFVKRPSDCRYAVVSHYSVEKHAEEVLVWDLYETQERLRGGRLEPPQPMHVGNCVDAAIMVAFMSYKDG